MSLRRPSARRAATPDAAQAFIARAPHRVACLIFPAGGSLDVAAAAEIFSTANGQLRRERGIGRDVYTFEVISSVPGPVMMEMGLKLMPDRTIDDPARPIDTLLISGGCWEPVEAALADGRLMTWLKATAPKVGRIVAYCTGSFLLAEAGLAKTAATTHWAHCDRLRERYPQLKVMPDNIYIKEGNVYSSAGATAAMDLTLALVEEDLGRSLAMNVARRMVMFLKRPGGQSQFSTALLTQARATDALKDLPEWILDHLDADLSVGALAARVGMSPRNFARVFAAETRLTPAKYVERARVERARQLIEETALPLLSVAARAGFESDQQMRRAFARWLAVTPAEYVERFRGEGRHIAIPPFVRTGRRRSEEAQPWLP